MVDSTTLQLRHTNIWVPNYQGVDPNDYIKIKGKDIKVASFDSISGLVYLDSHVYPNDDISVSYTYLDYDVEYQGFLSNKGRFYYLDLNPGPHHSLACQPPLVIPGYHDDFSAEPEDVHTRQYIGTAILIYLRPHSVYIGDQKVYSSQQTIYHTTMTEAELLAKDPLALPLGRIYVVPNSSMRDLVLMDARRRGGGLSELVPQEAIKELGPEAESYWDIGYWDGMPYQANGVIVLRLPKSLLRENGGRFTENEVRGILKKHMAFGVLPILEFV